ncbi:MAG: hypothetical protein NTX71_08775 [Candidatus Aureabacteria bacterium]|nr:hypothetical protein [Candidatus Auribacterota bacterium]
MGKGIAIILLLLLLVAVVMLPSILFRTGGFHRRYFQIQLS